MEKEINPFDKLRVDGESFDGLRIPSEVEGQSRTIKWSAPEFHYYDKGVAWYWLVIIATIVVVAIALWQKNFLFAVFAILAAILTVVWGGREPKVIDFILSERGLDIGQKKFYPYETLAGFAVIPTLENQELDELLIKTKSRLTSWLRIIIAGERREAIKQMLSRCLPEVEYQESLTDHIARILRF